MKAADKLAELILDVYIKTSDPTLRIATAARAGLPAHFKNKDWRLLKNSSSILHSDVPRDVAVNGYCYFQVSKGK